MRVVQPARDAGFWAAHRPRYNKPPYGGAAPCLEVFRIARTRLAELDQRIAELAALRDHFGRVVDQWEARLAVTPPGSRAGLLDEVGTAAPEARDRRRHRPPVKRTRP